MVLKESLMKLLKEKSISTITVKEICVLADINRSTFYSHYLDQFDLLNQTKDYLIYRNKACRRCVRMLLYQLTSQKVQELGV